MIKKNALLTALFATVTTISVTSMEDIGDAVPDYTEKKNIILKVVDKVHDQVCDDLKKNAIKTIGKIIPGGKDVLKAYKTGKNLINTAQDISDVINTEHNNGEDTIARNTGEKVKSFFGSIPFIGETIVELAERVTPKGSNSLTESFINYFAPKIGKKDIGEDISGEVVNLVMKKVPGGKYIKGMGEVLVDELHYSIDFSNMDGLEDLNN